MSTTTYRESDLPLLGPSVSSLTPNAFYERISGFYAERAVRAKPKAAKIKGKILSTATKTRTGSYELTYLGKNALLAFEKSKRLLVAAVSDAATALEASEDELRAFLTSKKFLVDTSDATA